MLAVYSVPNAAAGSTQGLNYQVRIEAPDQLKPLLEQNLDLMRWRGHVDLDLSQLQHRVKVAPEQVKALLATEGYYSPTVSAALETGDATPPVAHVIVDPGPPTLVGDVDIELQGFVPFDNDSAPFDANALRQRWSLPVGARFRQDEWEAAKRGLLRSAMQSRFPRAQLTDSQATVAPDVHRAKIKVVVDSGPEMRFGALHIEGLTHYPPSLITNLNKIAPGDEYNEAALQAFQARLQDTGYLSGVEVSADMSAVLEERLDEAASQAQPAKPRPHASNLLPVLVRVTENKQKNVVLGLGYSTNTGARAGVSYDDLSVLDTRMRSNFTYEQRHQNARVDFYWPTTPKGYNDSVGGGYERTNVNGEITRTTSVSATRKWGSPLLERNLTLEALTEQQTIDGLLTTRTKSVPLTFSITKRALDSLLLPTRGYVLSGKLGATFLPVLTDERFVRAYGRFIYYRPLGDKGALVLRAEAGVVASKEKAGVPDTFLFRAGGDQSVRGYGYQQLGVPAGTAIIGGRYLLTSSAEYDYWFKPPWGGAIFYDVGNAADSWHELKPKVGYGVGARWRSPVGPVGIDVAYGKAVHKVRLHFSLGFTF